MVIVLTETSATELAVGPGEPHPVDELWLSTTDTTAITGWSMKPEGFCKDDICVPTPPGKADRFVQGDAINLSAFWRLMGKPAVRSENADVWLLGEGASLRNDALLSLEAPDFTLPDLDGELHSLTDFRQKRVLLITWASW
ncbi:MAG: hypothetical protein IH872_09225 [Chloroflexi bacterium]|nr:hypothetical protein [Chloroflexota bacterium]